MIAPSAEIIEAANDQLSALDYNEQHQAILATQAKEFRSACPGRSEDFYDGCRLGMQAARIVLAGLPGAIIHKISI
jgi:hypothetical protein